MNSPKKEKAMPQASVSESRPSSPIAYQNPMFTSDMQGGPRLPPASARQSQETFPMATQPSKPQRYVPGQPSRNNASYNPYAEPQPTRNPYEPQNRYDDYRRPTDSPNMTNGMTRGGMSGFSQPSLAAPPYGTPDYNSSRPLFPRAQVTRPY
ncbi:protein transport protein sec31-like [Megalops cyprinoides]|uniref:protein transport protein sec31-like n=1 Tax=Megalops cyprinoides TaxID=118141 RepID=UPI001863BFDE|nr:protein transport protein sec31-like [Megalops cyprinoides]